MVFTENCKCLMVFPSRVVFLPQATNSRCIIFNIELNVSCCTFFHRLRIAVACFYKIELHLPKQFGFAEHFPVFSVYHVLDFFHKPGIAVACFYKIKTNLHNSGLLNIFPVLAVHHVSRRDVFLVSNKSDWYFYNPSETAQT